MQTRKLSVKAFYDLPPAEGLRVAPIVHSLTESPALSLLRTPVSFFQHSAVVSAAKVESGVDMTFDAHACSTRWHSASGHNPEPSGAIINLVSALTKCSVTIPDSADDGDIFISIPRRVRIDFRNCRLTGTGGQQKHRRKYQRCRSDSL